MILKIPKTCHTSLNKPKVKDFYMNQQTQLIYQDLKTRYKKATLSKTELANELSVSIATIDKYMRDGLGVPQYKKLGKAKNAKVIFNIVAVADFLAQTIETA